MTTPEPKKIQRWERSLSIGLDNISRLIEVVDYSDRRKITVAEAVVELVNAALSHGLNDE